MVVFRYLCLNKIRSYRLGTYHVFQIELENFWNINVEYFLFSMNVIWFLNWKVVEKTWYFTSVNDLIFLFQTNTEWASYFTVLETKHSTVNVSFQKKPWKINSYTIFVNCDKKKLNTNRRVTWLTNSSHRKWIFRFGFGF